MPENYAWATITDLSGTVESELVPILTTDGLVSLVLPDGTRVEFVREEFDEALEAAA